MVRNLCIVALTAWAACACGGSSLGKPIAHFPSADELDSLAARPAQPTNPVKAHQVERWELLPEHLPTGKTYPRETPVDELIVQASSHGMRPSPELRCAALETARFAVLHSAYPDDLLRGYLVARCGSLLPEAQIVSLEWDAPESTSDAELAIEPEVKRLLDQHGTRGAEIGGALVRGPNRAVFVAYLGVPRARLTAFSPLVTGESITITGQLDEGMERGLGLINHGPDGVEPCQPDYRVKAPQFRLTCPVHPDDEIARIEIAAHKPGEVLMSSVLRALVRRSESSGLLFEVELPSSPRETLDAKGFRSALLTALNERRERAGAPALKLEELQSTTNERLSGHYFEAAFRGDQRQSEVIALGLLAGWQVTDGIIRDGGFFAAAATSSRDPHSWLSYALSSPVGRWVLLDSAATRVAIGSHALKPQGMTGVVTTYSLFGKRDHSADETEVFDQLVKQRAARGQAAPRRRSISTATKAALEKIARQQASVEDAVDEAVQTTVQQERANVSLWIAETHDLRHLEFPDEVLRAANVEIGITHYKAPGAAWGQYVVVVLMRSEQRQLRAATDGQLPDAVTAG